LVYFFIFFNDVRLGELLPPSIVPKILTPWICQSIWEKKYHFIFGFPNSYDVWKLLFGLHGLLLGNLKWPFYLQQQLATVRWWTVVDYRSRFVIQKPVHIYIDRTVATVVGDKMIILEWPRKNYRA